MRAILTEFTLKTFATASLSRLISFEGKMAVERAGRLPAGCCFYYCTSASDGKPRRTTNFYFIQNQLDDEAEVQQYVANERRDIASGRLTRGSVFGEAPPAGRTRRRASWSWFGPGWPCWSGEREPAWWRAGRTRWDSRAGAEYPRSLCWLTFALSSWPSGLGGLEL